jgi:hypothetical protein
MVHYLAEWSSGTCIRMDGVGKSLPLRDKQFLPELFRKTI